MHNNIENQRLEDNKPITRCGSEKNYKKCYEHMVRKCSRKRIFRLCLGVWSGEEENALKGGKYEGKMDKSFKKFKIVIF